MFESKCYFREMLGSDEKITSNILSDRLSKLEEFGILIKTKDKDHIKQLVAVKCLLHYPEYLSLLTHNV